MGTWGLGTFEDDIARDWLEDLHDSDPFSFFVQCLDLTDLQELEFLACVGVVCSAEIILALLSDPRPGLPQDARRWILEHRGLNVLPLVPDVITGLRRVLDPESEMHQLWDDNQEMYGAWNKQMDDLIHRLEVAMVENH